MMKCIAALALFAASVFAQNVAIGAPADMSTATPGTNITVQINKPDTLTGSTDVGVGIGLFACGDSCAEKNVSQVLGDIMYSGPFNPQFVDGSPLPPNQNFSIAIPSTFMSGQYSLGVVHFAIVGASGTPLADFHNVTLVIS